MNVSALVNKWGLSKSAVARGAGMPINTLKYKLNPKNKYNELSPEEAAKVNTFLIAMAEDILKELK